MLTITRNRVIILLTENGQYIIAIKNERTKFMKKKIAVILTLCLLACTSLTACQTSSAPESTIPTSLPSVNSETAISETVSNTEPSNESSTELSEESSEILSEIEDISTINSTAENSVEESAEEISQAETSTEITSDSSSEEKTYSMDDVIRYGRTIDLVILEEIHKMLPSGVLLYILNVNTDTVDILYEGISCQIPIDTVELLPLDYVPNYE